MHVGAKRTIGIAWLSPRVASQLTWGGLFLVLMMLTSFALWVDFTMRVGSDDLGTIILASDAADTARDMAGDEQSLANQYRVAPSPELLIKRRAAGVAFVQALANAPDAGQAYSVETQILAGHARYMAAADQMFMALAAGNADAAQIISTEQVDPAFESFDGQLDAAAAAQRVLAHNRLSKFEALQNWVSLATLAVFALGLSLLGLFWSVLRALGGRAEFHRTELIRVTAETAAERELVRTKDELVAMVSHELASPATNLVAYAELLATQDHSTSERQEMLTTMVLEGQRMTAIIQEFLDIRRLETGHFDLALRPTDLLALLDHAVTIARRDVDHRLRVDLPALLPLVQADPARVQQILANLLSNARKYTPAGREIRVGARQIGALVEVYVADDGLGIPAAALPRLFEKFYRVPGEDRRDTKGTGLGLAVTKELIEAQGGQIGIESVGPGLGSRFWFTLPVAECVRPELQLGGLDTKHTSDVALKLVSMETLPMSAAALVDVLPTRAVRLLAVDDDLAIGSMIRRVMRSSGYETVTVTSAEEALERLRAERFDIVLSDLGLGVGMDGWGLAEYVRREWNIPFVLASGAVGLDAEEARSRGADGLMSKPYLPAELLAILNRLAPRHANTRAA